MSDSSTIRIRGIEDLQHKLEDPVWASRGVQVLFEAWSLFTLRETQKNMKRGKGGWVNRGDTRRSVAREIDSAEFPTYARVGSKLNTFRWGEYGTGLLSEDPDSGKRRHWPPAQALEEWALKHGFESGAEVARRIGLRGGLAPRRYLRNAAEASEGKMDMFVKLAASRIESEAEKTA